MKKLALLGSGGHGKVVADAALASGWGFVTFFDDAWPAKEANNRWPVAGDADSLLERIHEFDGIVVAIGNCAMRLAKHKRLLQAGAKMATIIHPQAVVSKAAKLGLGSVVMAGAIVNIDSAIGEACIINTGATVDHDVHLNDGVHICPGAHLAGGVHVGDCSWIGIGAIVRQSMKVGTWATVGAGAVVVASVPDGITVVGNPARPMSPSIKME